MINGNDILDLGYPEGKVIGLALDYARAIERDSANVKGGPDPDMVERMTIGALRAILNGNYDETRTEKSSDEFSALVQGLVEHRQREQAYAALQPREPVEYRTWGRELVDDLSVAQMEAACTLPIALRGALMPDAHLGYGLPIGGVLACDNAVIPYGVGVDIACRVMMTVTNKRLPEAPVEVSCLVQPFDTHADELARAIENETAFGVGASFGKGSKRQHAIMDDERWGEIPLLRGLKNKGYAQLGSSGGGNHFVEWGEFTTAERLETPYGTLAPGTYLALLSHSGSRGVGFKIANHYTRIAKAKCEGLPDHLKELAWLSLDDPDGQEYWAAMNFAGDYASACHHTIHENVLRAAGVKPLLQVENHHNFAWRQEVELPDGTSREAVVHRKGATPADLGELGLIPGTMAHPSYLVRGLGNPASLNSSSHGAGRCMSRTQAKKDLNAHTTKNRLKASGVTLLGAGLDEAPGAYKDIEYVLDAQSDLVERVGTFRPRIVKMAGDSSLI